MLTHKILKQEYTHYVHTHAYNKLYTHNMYISFTITYINTDLEHASHDAIFRHFANREAFYRHCTINTQYTHIDAKIFKYTQRMNTAFKLYLYSYVSRTHIQIRF